MKKRPRISRISGEANSSKYPGYPIYVAMGDVATSIENSSAEETVADAKENKNQNSIIDSSKTKTEDQHVDDETVNYSLRRDER